MAVASWRRPRWPSAVAAVYLVLAGVIALGGILHYQRPPPLSASSLVPLVAGVLGAFLVLFGAMKKISGILRLRRLPPGTSSFP